MTLSPRKCLAGHRWPCSQCAFVGEGLQRWVRTKSGLSLLCRLLCLEDSPPGDLNLHLAPPMLGKESFACRYPIINLHMQGQGSAGSQLLPVPSLGLCPSILVILQVEFVPL